MRCCAAFFSSCIYLLEEAARQRRPTKLMGNFRGPNAAIRIKAAGKTKTKFAIDSFPAEGVVVSCRL